MNRSDYYALVLAWLNDAGNGTAAKVLKVEPRGVEVETAFPGVSVGTFEVGISYTTAEGAERYGRVTGEELESLWRWVTAAIIGEDSRPPDTGSRKPRSRDRPVEVR